MPGRLCKSMRTQIAVHDDSGLWLTLWVKRSPRGEFFVMLPRSDPKWNVHTSYHLDGRLHMKSYGHKTVETNCQPLTGVFRGTQSLGMYGGHGPKGIGAICDPKAFSGVVEVGPGVLGPIHGTVAVDLVEPGHEPMAFPGKIVTEQTFRDIVPWLVIRAGPLSAKPVYKKIKGCGERADTKDAIDFSGHDPKLRGDSDPTQNVCGTGFDTFILGKRVIRLCKACCVKLGLIW